jgi:hypothetical protein
MLLLWLVFLLPSVQQLAAKKGIQYFNETFSQNASLKGIQYTFPNQIELEKLLLPDFTGDTLFYIGSLRATILGFSQISNKLAISSLVGDSVFFHLLKHPQRDSSNFSLFMSQIIDPKKPRGNKAFTMSVENLNLTNSRFLRENRNESDGTDRFFWNSLEAEIEHFILSGPDVGGNIHNLSFNDPAGFKLKSLKSEFFYGSRGLKAQKLNLITDRSHLSGSLIFTYLSASAYLNFVDSVNMEAEVLFSNISTLDVQYFAKAYPDFPAVKLQGKASGTVNDFYLEDITLETAENTIFKGQLHLEETTRLENLYLQSEDFSLTSSSADVRRIVGLFADSLSAVVDKIGNFKWSGKFDGGIYSFTTDSKLSGDLIEADLNFEARDFNLFDKAKYKGDIVASKINLGLISGIDDLGLAAVDLFIEGSGFSPFTMKTKVRGDISHLDYKNYGYTNLSINGLFDEGLFDGDFKAKDPNLNFDFSGQASFASDTITFDFAAQIDSANLFATNLIADSGAQYSGNLLIDLKAIDYDHWQGFISLKDSEYRNSRKNHYFQDIKVISLGQDSLRVLRFNSDILEGDIKGDFSLIGLARTFEQNLYKFFWPLKYNPSLLTTSDFNYHLKLKSTSLLTQLLMPKLLIEPGTEVSGSYRNNQNRLNIDLISRGIRYENHIFRDIKLDFKSSLKENDISIFFENYTGKNALVIDSISMFTSYVDDSMNFQLDFIMRDSIDSYADFRGRALIADSANYHMIIDSSEFNLGKESFYVSSGSSFRLDSNGFSIDYLKLQGLEQNIIASGYINKNANQVFRLNAEQIDLRILNYLFPNEKARFKGKLQTEIVATQLLDSPRFLANLSIDSLNLNGVPLGNLKAASDFDYSLKKIFLDGSLNRGNLQSLLLKGFYNTDSTGIIDLSLDFNRFQIAALEPFASPIAENLRGLLNGSININGPILKPVINGSLRLPKAAMTISFLQTDYNLVGDPEITITNSEIAFPKLNLRDTRFGTAGVLSGKVLHQNFKDFLIDLKIDASELLVLNTKSEAEDAYFGTAFASGVILVKGPPNKVKVKAVVESARNTSFNIPIGGATEVKQSGFVTFISPDLAADLLGILNNDFNIDEGVSLDFDINVNPKAKVSIILNESTGNQLNARGDGLIKMKLEPSRDLELYGTYTVSKGEYRFNIEGLFAKNFEVERGGTVTWNGDPYAARLDLVAKYVTKANPGLLTGESSAVSTPVEVYLYISGGLTNPNIAFDIKAPRASSTTQAILANRLNTDQAINQQVFSLLAFNSFTPPSEMFAATGNGINQWDIIANQAAAFINRFTGGYEFSFNYQPASTVEAIDGGLSNEEFEVGLSKNFFNERLTINSSVEVPLNENNSNIAGDFEVLYSLTPDGRIRAKAFNRSVDNGFNLNVGQQQLYQQGVGMSFKTDFNNYRQIWKKVLSKARKEEKVESDTNQSQE